jgi:hypothetical protein
MPSNPLRWVALLACFPLGACSSPSTAGSTSGSVEHTAATQAELQVAVGEHSVSFEFADVTFLPAGVAAGENVIFIGDPLEGRVFAYSRFTGRALGELPQPPGGFAIPFIMHSLGEGRVGVLGAGGLPQPVPFVPASPLIYEYTYTFSHASGFSASLARLVTFGSVLIGFAEDFARMDDGRFLVTDAILGSIWVVQTDGTITPGIVPKTFDPQDGIPSMRLCPTMPEVTVNGVPFLFSGSTNPGIEGIAVRGGTVYFSSPCGRGLYAFPASVLSDNRQPFQRAADIRLVSPTPANIQVEELLELQFNPFDPDDHFVYAAHGLQLEITRIDVRTGERQVVAHDPRLFDFPSSLAFLPPVEGFEREATSMVVVSNQQERTPITNDAVTQDSFNLPFIVAKVVVTR